MQEKMRWLRSSPILVMLAVALNGCVAAVPILINRLSTLTEHIATAEVSGSAEQIFSALVRDAEGADPGMKIANRDD